uniref:Uncharacterized protein n=1 Tax=Dunaliella tertiolecta TaxID=3047 RepID=A0A7S3R396_DUNTE
MCVCFCFVRQQEQSCSSAFGGTTQHEDLAPSSLSQLYPPAQAPSSSSSQLQPQSPAPSASTQQQQQQQQLPSARVRPSSASSRPPSASAHIQRQQQQQQQQVTGSSRLTPPHQTSVRPNSTGMPRPAERVLSSGVKALHSNIPAQPHLERSNTAQGAQDGEGMQAEASGSYTHAGFDPEVEGLAEEWSEASSKGRSAGGSEGGKKNKASPPASTKPMSVLDAALQAFKEEQRMLNKARRAMHKGPKKAQPQQAALTRQELVAMYRGPPPAGATPHRHHHHQQQQQQQQRPQPQPHKPWCPASAAGVPTITNNTTNSSSSTTTTTTAAATATTTSATTASTAHSQHIHLCRPPTPRHRPPCIPRSLAAAAAAAAAGATGFRQQRCVCC